MVSNNRIYLIKQWLQRLAGTFLLAFRKLRMMGLSKPPAGGHSTWLVMPTGTT